MTDEIDQETAAAVWAQFHLLGDWAEADRHAALGLFDRMSDARDPAHDAKLRLEREQLAVRGRGDPAEPIVRAAELAQAEFDRLRARHGEASERWTRAARLVERCRAELAERGLREAETPLRLGTPEPPAPGYLERSSRPDLAHGGSY